VKREQISAAWWLKFLSRQEAEQGNKRNFCLRKQRQQRSLSPARNPLTSWLNLSAFSLPFALQLHGNEAPELIAALRGRVSCQIWKALPLPPATERASVKPFLEQIQSFAKAGCDAFVLDTATAGGFGGTGEVASWELAADLVRLSDVPCFLAGGLTPENVTKAVIAVKPYGVDVSSGVENSPGVKDPEKIRLFCQRAKQSL
jgi:phosphoribosylanthranilate isomerase